MTGVIMVGLSGLALGAALVLTLLGLVQVVAYRRLSAPRIESVVAHKATTLPASVQLEGVGPVPLEPGVLLNTLWEHLPNADCQSGECGGCKMRLLDGEVRWIREPVVEIDRHTHILACSCEPIGAIRCATL